jgi:hypothetical protein
MKNSKSRHIENSNLILERRYLNEDLNLVKLSNTSYSNVKYDTDGTQNDLVNKALLDDLQKAGEAANVILTITTAKTGHGTYVKGSRVIKSRHMKNTAVDIAILNGIGSNYASNSTNGNPKFREYGNRVKDALVQLGYTWNTERGQEKAVLWQTNKGGNHYNHLHVSNKTGYSSGTTPTKITPEIDNIGGKYNDIVNIENAIKKEFPDSDSKLFSIKSELNSVSKYFKNLFGR